MKQIKNPGDVWLVNADGDYTIHAYHGRERVLVPRLRPTVAADGTRSTDEPGDAILYRCARTGAVKRYGLECALPPSKRGLAS